MATDKIIMHNVYMCIVLDMMKSVSTVHRVPYVEVVRSNIHVTCALKSSEKLISDFLCSKKLRNLCSKNHTPYVEESCGLLRAWVHIVRTGWSVTNSYVP